MSGASPLQALDIGELLGADGYLGKADLEVGRQLRRLRVLHVPERGEALDEGLELRGVLEILDLEPVADHPRLFVDIHHTRLRRDLERELHNLKQRFVCEDAINARDVGRLAGEVEGEPDALALPPRVLLERLAHVPGYGLRTRAVEHRRSLPVTGEVEG